MRDDSRHWSKKPPSSRKVINALFGNLDITSRSFRARPELLNTVATDFYQALNTPVSLSCEILLRYGELEQLCSKNVDPRDFNCPYEFRDSYQAVGFLKKAPLVIPGVDPEAAAKVKFFEAERECRLTNQRVRDFIARPLAVPGPVLRVITTAMAKINSVLSPEIDSREWLYACRFGPGAFNHPEAKGLTSLYDKLQVRPSVSPDLKDIAALLVMSQPQWARSITDSEDVGFWPIPRGEDFDLVPGNRVAFVPKTAITHRAIAIEPLMNVYAQLGIGTVMRRKLKRCGVDLDDQSANQRAALQGSLDGSLATIDLSSASDTVAKELVRLLLPPGWFNLLDMTRSKVGFIDGNWLRYEKFSSMGNGYTFELESLIFWALSVSVCTELETSDSDVLVYGDDIIVPSSAYDLLKEVLEFCGFSLNGKKSFASGPFRESCGKDYYNGIDVRPFFQKEIPNEIHNLFSLANGIRGLAHRRNSFIGCDVRLLEPWSTVLRAIPRSIRNFVRVPAHAGDTVGIKSNWDESQASPFVISNKDGWEGISGLRYQPVPISGPECSNMLGVVASLLYKLDDGGTFESKTFGTSPQEIENYTSWLRIKGGSDSASPRQGRGCQYRLVKGAFYGPWTDYGGWERPA